MMKDQVLAAWRFFLALVVIVIAIGLILTPSNIDSSPPNIVNAIACFFCR